MTLWSGRFTTSMDATLWNLSESYSFDHVLYHHDIMGTKAHVGGLQRSGLLSEGELEEILAALDQIEAEFDRGVFVRSGSDEDIHMAIERRATELAGDVGAKIHTSRSRNDQVATTLRLFTRDALVEVAGATLDLVRALQEAGEKSPGAYLPGYTHLQRAEPVLVAHWLLAYIEMILRDASRLTDCAARLNYCPLGSGAVAGATLALDRTIAARELATSDRDFALEYVQAAATLGIHISRFAEEITLFATSEFGFIELPESFSTGSSAMPQKKNPDMTELLRGKSGRLLGAATTLATLLKGLPLAYNKDLQETQEPVFAVADTLEPMLQLLPKFTRALRFRNERMESAAQSGYLNAMAAATYLVHKGVPFRTAHEKIGNAVRFALEKGVELDQLSLVELRAFGPEFAEDFFPAIQLNATLDCHDVTGGTARGRVNTALELTAKKIAALTAGNQVEAVHAGA